MSITATDSVTAGSRRCHHEQMLDAHRVPILRRRPRVSSWPGFDMRREVRPDAIWLLVAGELEIGRAHV